MAGECAGAGVELVDAVVGTLQHPFNNRTGERCVQPLVQQRLGGQLIDRQRLTSPDVPPTRLQKQ